MSLFSGMKLNVGSGQKSDSSDGKPGKSPHSKPVDVSDCFDDNDEESTEAKDLGAPLSPAGSVHKQCPDTDSKDTPSEVTEDDILQQLDHLAHEPPLANTDYSAELAGLDLDFQSKEPESDSCDASALSGDRIPTGGERESSRLQSEEVDLPSHKVVSTGTDAEVEAGRVTSGFSFIQEPMTSEDRSDDEKSADSEELEESVQEGHHVEDLRDTDAPGSGDTAQPCYRLQLTQNEEFELTLQTSEADIQSIRAEIAIVAEQQDAGLKHFQNIHVRHIAKLQLLKELQGEQSKALAEEDFETAEDIDKRVSVLQQEVDASPPPSMFSLEDIRSFVEATKSLHDREMKQRMERCKLLTAQKEKEEASLEEDRQKFNSTFLKEKGEIEKEKIQLEKSLSHLSIDREHLEKSEIQLDAKIGALTSAFVEKKQSLQEEMKEVKNEILELERKLVEMRQKEVQISADISEEEAKIEQVNAEFQDERQKLAEERDKIGERQVNIDRGMETVSRAEVELCKKKEEIETKESRSLHNKEALEEQVAKETEEIEELKCEQVKLMKITFEEKDWPSLQINTHGDLDSSKKKVNALEADVKDKMAAILKSQTSVTTLRKKVNDIEEQIESLNESKKLAVAGRNFTEAKRLSNEVKELTATGESCQKQLEDTTEEVAANNKVLEKLQEEFKLEKDSLQREELQFDLKLQEAALGVIHDARAKLENPDLSALHRKLVQAETLACCFLVRELCIKHDTKEPAEVSGYLSGLKAELEGDVDADIRASEGVEADGCELGEEIKQQISRLEEELQEAVDEEDYDTAQILDTKIETLKKKANSRDSSGLSDS